MQEKLEKKVKALSGGEEFMESVAGLTVPQMEARISQMQKDLEDSETHREENTDLRDLKEELKLLNGGYNDVKKAVRLKTKYLITMIKDKGGT